MENNGNRVWFGISPWIIIGSVVILVPIFVFWTMQNIKKQEESWERLMLEKGAALIRSFEAGTRTGMMGMMGMEGSNFQLQELLSETAQLPDIDYLFVINRQGRIIAHNNPVFIGRYYGQDLDLERISHMEEVDGRHISHPDGPDTFEVFRRFAPVNPHIRGQRQRPNRMMADIMELLGVNPTIIFVGLDMKTIEEARKEDLRHTVIMAIILLMIGIAGIFSLLLLQAYRATRSSLTRIKAFSDNVVENMPIGLLALDMEERIVSFNDTAKTILRLDSERIAGKKASELLNEELITSNRELENDRPIIEKEIDYPLADGRLVPLEVSHSLLKGEDNSSLGYMILFRDLTEVQELKREVERNRRLVSLGRLAAGIAHEIRNPLSSIKGFATYFGERYKDFPDDKKTADIMIQEVERLNRVIGQLLDFAKPLSVVKQNVDVKELIQHSFKMIERQADKKNIKTSMNISGHINEIYVDQDRMNQVLLNLYLNAIDAMEENGTLSVDVSKTDDPARIKLIISDSGTGITKEDLLHVFDPYFTTKQTGTGLGLAIVHNIIESHKGDIKMESNKGEGTRIIITLPDSEPKTD